MLACKNARAFDRATDMRKKAPRILGFQRMSGAIFEYRLAARERGRGPAERCGELIRKVGRRGACTKTCAAILRMSRHEEEAQRSGAGFRMAGAGLERGARKARVVLSHQVRRRGPRTKTCAVYSFIPLIPILLFILFPFPHILPFFFFFPHILRTSF